MSSIEPIKIPFDLTPEDVEAQAKEVQKSLSDIDHASDKARADLKNFVNEQEKAHKSSARSVKAVKTQYNGLNNSINQITRELPAFTYNAQTGFMAISNNIPMLADSIANLRRQNAELVASGQKGKSIFKQLGGALFSWNTLLSVGITLITVYGKEIGNWISNLYRSSSTLGLFKRRLNAINTAFEKTKYTKASRQLLKLKADFKLAEKGVITKEKALKAYNDSVGKVMGTVNSFAKAERKLISQGDEYVKMMLYKAAAIASLDSANEEITKRQKEKLQKEKELISAKENLKLVEGLNYTDGIINTSFGTTTQSPKDRAETAFTAAKLAVEKTENELKKIEESSVETYNSLMDNARKIAETFSFNLYGDETTDKSKKIASEYKKLLSTLKDLDKEYTKQTFDKDKQELNALKDKFSKVRTLIQEFNQNPKNKVKISLGGLADLERKATASLQYRQGTAKLVTSLEKEQELYEAYEAFKTEVGISEAQKRYNLEFAEYESYLQRIQGEIKKVQSEPLTAESSERLKQLTNLETSEKNRQTKKSDNRFAEAYQEALTYEERKQQLISKYETQRVELSKITDEKLRQQKLQALAELHSAEMDKLNASHYEQAQLLENLSTNLLGITKQQLQNRIESIEEYVRTSKGKLTKEQLAYISNELKKAKAVQASTDIGVEEKVLLEEKKRLVAQISAIQNKGNGNVKKELEDLEQVNGKLKGILAKKAGKIASAASQIGGAFDELSGVMAEFDEGLADTFETMGDLTNVASNAAGAFASFASGDVVGGITGAISAISGIFSMSAKARESERKARAEIKKWHEEIFESQLAYNAELRKRILDEIKLNDIYKSRVENIKEEIAANKKNAKEIVKEQQELFSKLLSSKTIVDKQTYKTGGFLGAWQKTKVRNIEKTVAELLGIGTKGEKQFDWIKGYTQEWIAGTAKLTDEIYEDLEKINKDKPLTGDAKAAYEQLKKLKEEYGSIEEATRQLEIQLKDSVTGTTAKSIADSIKQGIASGKKSFADFADDIEGFLRQAMLAGMSAKVIEPQMQKLQDELYAYLGDGVLTSDEKKQFQEMYMKVVEEARTYSEMINQSGLKITKNNGGVNSIKGAYKTASQESISLLAGETGGLRLTQLNTNSILKGGFAQQLATLSKQVELQQKIERNTRKTAENTEELTPIRKGIEKLSKNVKSTENTAKANGF